MFSKTTKINEEIYKFNKIAKDWWNPSGKFKILHNFNKERINYILSVNLSLNGNNTLNNLDILDIGCGGGLLSEPLATKGANVTGIDASYAAIEAAKNHSKDKNLNINYVCTTPEEFITDKKFDIVLAMEILEHVTNFNNFIELAIKFLKPEGIIIFSTINRNLKSILLAKYAAEYVLNWLPKGIHNYKKFITPFELEQSFKKYDFSIQDLKGINFNLFNNSWNLSSNPKINYIGYAKKINN